MTVKPRLQSLWRNLRSRRRVEASLQAEVRHYLDLLTEAKIATGMRPEEARRAALIEMGGMDQVKEQVREVRVGHMLDTIWQDLRYGARMLVKSPLFTAAAVLTLGLGIGANSAIFSVVNGVLLRALPFDHPDRLVRVCATYGNDLIMVTSFKDLADWQKETHMFEGLAAFGRDRDALAGTTGAEMIDTADVSPGFFELLKVSPILGRTFSDGDKPGHRIGPDYPITGADGVTILGESFWKQQFGSDPSVIGRSLVVDGYPSTVIGVVPDRFGSLVGRPKMWFPWAPNPVERRSSRHLPIISRLKPNVTSEQASNEMGLIASRLRGLYPDDDYRIGATVLSLQQTIVGDVRKMLLILFGVVALVLLIACANVANLVLARAAGRWREIAIRSALGASRGRLVRQLFTENLLLSSLGAAFGVLIGSLASRFLVKQAPGDIPRIHEIRMDSRVIGFTIVLSIITTLIFGLAPAFRIAGSALNESLKEVGRGVRGGRRQAVTRGALVVAELSISLLLLIGSGLLIRSFHSLRSVDPGFDPENVASVNIGLPENEDKGSQSRVLFYDKIFQHLGSLQGVGSTALTTRLPFGGGGSFEWDGAVPEGRPMVRAESIGSDYRRVSPGYFRTMRIHLTRGREFNEFDGKTGAKVVIISETMARRCWPDQEAVGKHLFFFDSGKLVPHEVVGVAGDAKFGGLDALNDQASYVPIPQDPTPWVYVVTRSSQSAATIAGSIGSMIGLIDKELNVDTVTTMDDLRDEALATPRFNLMLISIFAGLALTLAAIGTYSVISCSASERTQEIGIRMALGASRTEVICLVAGQTAKLALIGVAIGVAAAFALTRLMQSLLFHVSPRDWATYTAVSIFLLAITLAASFIPARRASTVDPLRALRYE